ncbi:hypothetical protein [Dongia sp.]|uniref:hypothetical protein n=1 Tax=Dongia sp. TaxID=1977262 RepID=UPI0035B13FB9
MEQNSNKRKIARVGIGHPGRIQRRCLQCGGSFVTLSPFLRVCPLCKESEEWQSGNDDVPFNHPRRPANDNE